MIKWFLIGAIAGLFIKALVKQLLEARNLYAEILDEDLRAIEQTERSE